MTRYCSRCGRRVKVRKDGTVGKHAMSLGGFVRGAVFATPVTHSAQPGFPGEQLHYVQITCPGSYT